MNAHFLLKALKVYFNLPISFVFGYVDLGLQIKYDNSQSWFYIIHAEWFLNVQQFQEIIPYIFFKIVLIL